MPFVFGCALMLFGCVSHRDSNDRVHGSAGMQMFSNNLAAGARLGVPF